MREQVGKYCLDVSKLVLGGTVISAIMKEDIHLWSVVLFGAAVVLIFAVTGFLFIKHKK